MSKFPTTFSPAVTKQERNTALTLLGQLKVRKDNWSPPEAYQRQLVVHMPKFPNLGLDMKDYILARDLIDRVFDSDGFTLRKGTLHQCPYSGIPVQFSQTDAKNQFLVHIDHIVSISDAWNSGGYKWNHKGRKWQQLCNDPANLLAVSRAANTKKSDHNAAGWLPSNRIQNYQERFVILQIAIKSRYNLSVTESEKIAMQTVLTTSN